MHLADDVNKKTTYEQTFFQELCLRPIFPHSVKLHDLNWSLTVFRELSRTFLYAKVIWSIQMLTNTDRDLKSVQIRIMRRATEAVSHASSAFQQQCLSPKANTCIKQL